MSPAKAYRHLRDLMTLEEKASLMSGGNFWNTKPVPRLGIPAIMLTDGPHGLRKQGGAADHLGLNASIPATCFPTASALASSWDEALLERVGEALGAESAAERVSVLLGPGLNIKRNPLGGRNFEYLSEDPLLSGRLAASLIRGIQSRGVAACAKHFAVNSQETHRMTIDEIVDERALHELYLEGFRIAIAEGRPQTIMSSYNRVNGIYANEHPELLTGILRDRWGFDGLVVSDWGGNNDRVAAMRAGSALEMPSTDGVTDREIVAAVEAGELDEAVLDARVDELLRLIELTEPAAEPPAGPAGSTTASPGTAATDFAAHHELAVEAARRSSVLLENPHGTLPLGPGSGRIAVIGDFAATPRFQGAGSSLVNPTRVDNALDELRASGLDIVGYEPGFARIDRPSKRRLERALRLAKQADIVLLFLGLDESAEAEGVDRAHMRLARNQLELVFKLLARESRIVVVLTGGSPVELPFAGRVEAVLHGHLGGQGSGRAVVDVLTGAANPSGRLAESYPLRYEDVPSAASYTNTEATSEHRDSIYLGYRYYDKIGLPVRYPFGHGLGYTSFEYTALSAGRDAARLTVTNTGDRAGREVVQLYVEAPRAAEGEFRAPRELRGFASVELEPGESREIEIAVADHAFQVFDPEAHDWRTVPGRYELLIGASSRDIRLREAVTIRGGKALKSGAELLPHYVSGRVEQVDGAEFSRLIGRELPSPDWPVGGPLTRADIVAQAKGRGGFGGLLFWSIDTARRLLMLIGRPLSANSTSFALDLPFRSISRLSGGAVDDDMLDGVMLMVNRRFWPGLRHTLRAWRARRSSSKK